MKFDNDDDGDDDVADADGVDHVMTSTAGEVWARLGAQRFLSPRSNPLPTLKPAEY